MKKGIFKKKSTFIALAAVVIIAALYFFRVRQDMSDFGVCLKAGQRILAGENLYRESDGHRQYKYSPVSALFFAAFALVSKETANIVWYALQFIFLITIFSQSYKILPDKNMNAGRLALWTFLILAKFLGREIELGQINLFIIFLLSLMIVCFLRKKDFPVGLLWGASLFFKPYALVFLPYFILKKRSKVCVSGLALFVIGLAVPALAYGFPRNLLIHKEWASSLSHSTPGLLSVGDNGSLYGFFLKIFPASWKTSAEFFLVLAVLILGCALLWMMTKGSSLRSSQRPEVLEFAFLLILIPFLSPLGWYYNYLYSFLAIMLLVSGIIKFPFFLRGLLLIDFVMIGGTLYEILGRKLFRFYTDNSIVVINYLIVLFCLFYLRLKREC